MRVTMLALLLTALPAWAAPPSLDIPAEVRPTGEYATVKPKTDAVTVMYIGLSGVDGFPSDFLKDPRHFVLPVRGLAAGTYKFAAVGAAATGEQTRTDFAVVVGAGGPVNPPPVDPPPPPPAKGLYFLVVRADGPANPAFTYVMGDAAWGELRKAGHQIKDKTLTEAATIGLSLPSGTALPCVVTLREKANGMSEIVRDAVPLPTTGDAIRKLPEGVK